MDRPILLIADSSEDFRTQLKKALDPYYRVLCCQDGKTALQLLRSEHPAVMVMDPLLPELDGISVLQSAAAEHIRPVVLLTGTWFSYYVQEAACSLGVAYLIRKPCDILRAVERIQDMEAIETAEKEDLRGKLHETLLSLGFSAKRKGFSYLVEVLMFILRFGNQPLTKVVYPAVGKHYGYGWKSVERAIRTAVEAAWESGERGNWSQVMMADLEECPSNGEFIERFLLQFAQKKERYDLTQSNISY